jgi:hypothetical protein
MTKKHFEPLAANLKQVKPYSGQYNDFSEYVLAFSAWSNAVQKIADMCQGTNKNFKKALFLQACGLELDI